MLLVIMLCVDMSNGRGEGETMPILGQPTPHNRL